MSQKTLKFKYDFSVLAQYFMNHYNFLLFQSIEECTKNSPLCQRMFVIFLLGNYNKIILPPTTIYTFSAILTIISLIRDWWYRCWLQTSSSPRTCLWSVSEYIYISTRRGQGREVEVKIHLSDFVAWDQKRQSTIFLSVLCS